MKKIKLGDCATFINGYAFKPSDWKKIGTPIVRIQDLTGSIQNPNFYDGNLDEKYMIDNGDILISWSGSLGIYEWNKGKAYLNQHIFKVEFDKIEFNKRYFVYLVKSKINEMLKNVHGSTMKHITKKNFDKIQIELHSLERQQEIAQKLDIIQKIIDIRKKQIEELEQLIKSQFVEMFGDIKSNDKNWKTKNGSELFIFSSGKSNKTSNLSSNFEYKCYGGNGITGLSKDYLIDYDTIVIGRVGAYCGSVHTTEGKVWITDNAIYIKEFKEDYNIKFLKELFEVIDFHRFANFSGQPKITQQPLQNYSYILPPIELQNQFADIVKQIDKQKFEIQKNLEEMQKLQESLMNKYFG